MQRLVNVTLQALDFQLWLKQVVSIEILITGIFLAFLGYLFLRSCIRFIKLWHTRRPITVWIEIGNARDSFTPE